MTELQRKLLAAGLGVPCTKKKEKVQIVRPWVAFLLGVLVGYALYAILGS